MKKLIMSAIIVACALGAQASAVDWSVALQVKTEASYSDLTGYTAYLFAADTWDSIKGGFSSGTASASDFAGYLGSQALAVTTAATAKTFSTGGTVVTSVPGTLDTSSFYIVLADLDNGGDIWAKAATADIYDNTADPVPSHSAAAWSVAKGNTGGYMRHSNAYGTVSVPEPTSGLMLLLGLAGLALKRKRA